MASGVGRGPNRSREAYLLAGMRFLRHKRPRPWRTTLAPTVTCFPPQARKGYCLTAFGRASVRMKLAMKERHENRARLMVFLPSLIHYSASSAMWFCGRRQCARQSIARRDRRAR
jgi:hypothetical protein